MKPLVTFPDPEAAVISYLTAALAARSESYLPTAVTYTTKDGPRTLAPVSTEFPPITLDNAAHVQVELEAGSAQDYPVTERAQVRVTAHVPPTRGAGDTVGGRSDVKRLASLAQGLLLAWDGDENVSGVFPGISRSDVVKDDATNNLMVWFLVRVDLKATLLAS